ncbi:MAG TPA: hypothetical protein DCX54_11820 [Flavobacteriales bacterium]|nr:hypothetical protein [Flavobacteriales bacterium]
MTTRNKRLGVIALVCGGLLLIPLTAMLLTDEVNWSLFDFIVAGVLLFGTGFLCELVIRKVKNRMYRFAVCAVILMGLVLFWAELAVGIFNSPIAGQ